MISVSIPNQEGNEDYGNMLSVVSRCFQLMSARTENSWRRYSNIVISPPVADMAWDSFASASRLDQTRRRLHDGRHARNQTLAGPANPVNGA